MLKTVDIYTDGACSGNPGPGGYGAIIRYGDKQKEFSGGEKNTTNNRMELTGAIVALSALKERCNVNLYSDSKYLIDAIEKGWVNRWKSNNWMRTPKERALNVDLWEKLLELLEAQNVNFIWVKGHNGHPENERCDFLATNFIKNNS